MLDGVHAVLTAPDLLDLLDALPSVTKSAPPYFPLAVDKPVTCLTANSPEVVAALASQKEPAEMNTGDVFKIDVAKRTGKQLRVSL